MTSRDWERLRAAGSRLEVEDRVVVRGGRSGLVVRAWTLAAAWDAPHRLEVAVALPDADGRVETHGETLTFWPFTRAALTGTCAPWVSAVRTGGRGPLPRSRPDARGRRRWRISSTVSVTVSAIPRPSARPFHGASSNASPPM